MSTPKTPGIILPDWSRDDETGVLILHVALTADCKVANIELNAVKGCEAEAAMVAFKLGDLFGEQLKRPDRSHCPASPSHNQPAS